jgi:hypothetical protein
MATVVGSMAVNKKVSAPHRGPLELALAARDVEAVRVAIASGADVNQCFADGLTPLCRMAALGERRILKLLLNANANPDQRPPPRDEAQPVSDVASQVVSAGFSALHWACRENKMECVKLLLESKAIVDVRAADNVTPFMLACKNGYHELAKQLMVAGADIEAANVRGGTAMVVACVMGNAEILRTLLAMRAKADAVTVAIDDSEELFECRPLVTACRYNHPKCVSLLLAEALSAETLAIATKELEEFPSFTECAKLVRRAVERREQREQRFGVRPPAAPVASADVDAVSATERADAAMAALIAEEMKPRTAAAPPKPSGKKKRPAAQHAKKAREADAAAAASMAMASLSSSLSSSSAAAAAAAAAVMPTAAELEMTVTAEETAATAEVAAAAATGAPGTEPAGSVAAEAATTPLRTSQPGTPRSPTSPPKPDMHALLMEYELYQYQTSETHQRRKSQEEAEDEEDAKPNQTKPSQAKPSQAWLGLCLEDDDDGEEEGEEGAALGKRRSDDKGGEGKENLSRSSNSDEDGPTAQNEEPAPLLQLSPPLVAAEAKEKEYAQLDALLRRRLSARSADDAGNEMSQLNMYFSRKKFTTSAMSFFLTKFRESSLPRETVVPLTEDERRRRKARRPPPPPGCLSPDASATSQASRLAPPLPPPAAAAAAGAEPSLRPVSTTSSSNPMPITAPSHRLARSASYAELERRLEQELEAARMREASLEQTLKQRSDALSHLVICPITHEPMVDPVSAADGQTYERRAIEAWIKKGTVPISPLTGEPLEDLTLRPNFLAKALAQERAGN